MWRGAHLRPFGPRCIHRGLKRQGPSCVLGNGRPIIVHVPTETLVCYNAAWAGPLLGDKTWSVLFDNSKVMAVAGRFECTVSMEEGLRRAAEHYRKRAAAYRPDAARHALLNRIAAEQEALGK